MTRNNTPQGGALKQIPLVLWLLIAGLAAIPARNARKPYVTQPLCRGGVEFLQPITRRVARAVFAIIFLVVAGAWSAHAAEIPKPASLSIEQLR